MADITLADFWGIEKVDKTMDKDLGTSLVMLNSKKGEAFYQLIQRRINSVPVPFEGAVAGNPALLQPLPTPKVDRRQFFEDIDKMSFEEIRLKYIQKPQKDSYKSKIKKELRFWKIVASETRLNPKALWQFFCLTQQII